MMGVIEGLRGEASQIASDIGLAKVMTQAGSKQLLIDLENAIFLDIAEDQRFFSRRHSNWR